jgi:hypothetical protein
MKNSGTGCRRRGRGVLFPVDREGGTVQVAGRPFFKRPKSQSYAIKNKDSKLAKPSFKSRKIADLAENPEPLVPPRGFFPVFVPDLIC